MWMRKLDSRRRNISGHCEGHNERPLFPGSLREDKIASPYDYDQEKNIAGDIIKAKSIILSFVSPSSNFKNCLANFEKLCR